MLGERSARLSPDEIRPPEERISQRTSKKTRTERRTSQGQLFLGDQIRDEFVADQGEASRSFFARQERLPKENKSDSRKIGANDPTGPNDRL